MSQYHLRVFVFGFTAILTVIASAEFLHVVSGNGLTNLEILATVLFVPCFAWGALGAFIAVVGVLSIFERNSYWPKLITKNLVSEQARTAILIPIYNEQPEPVMARVEVMFRALQKQIAGKQFDFFILSDSTQSNIWLAEQAAWRKCCSRLSAFGRIFYRRRANNEGKKAGNIRDFCTRYGGSYRYLLVLDADSVVSGETMIELLLRMESNPRIGIIQVPPLPVRRKTLFARWQQFAARVYGPIWARGESFICGPDGNYYGHNAIIRRDAFTEHAGLGDLPPGNGPFSGPISSHDFVEAALIRRAGYEVWIAFDLGGSYEQCPTTLIDYAIRDKRWCRGNLQHLRIAALPGLVAWSRVHFIRGAMAYIIPPLWLLLVTVMLLVAADDISFQPTYFREAQRTLFPLWPVYHFHAARELFIMTMAILMVPRAIGAVFSLVEMVSRRELPLRRIPHFLVSVVGEWIMGALLTPALVFFQTTFILSAFTGERIAWNAQKREERRVGITEALVKHAPHMLAAGGLGIVGWFISSQTLLWLLPLIIPLAISPLLSIITSSAWVGRIGDFFRLFWIPEDDSTSNELVVYDEQPGTVQNENVRNDDARYAWAQHAMSVLGSSLLQRLSETRREELRQRLRSGELLSEADRNDLLTDTQLILEILTAESEPKVLPEELTTNAVLLAKR